MERTVRIQAPLPHIKSVNIWLLRGDPLTLIDTGPRTDEALVALEAGLRREGLRIEDIELVIPTHHHLDHSGLIATIVGRSGARVAALDRAADYGATYAERSASDRSFSVELMRHHGVPESVIEANEGFWDFIRDTSEAFETDVVLSDGDVITAGGRDLRILARPGHSTTDALLVDEASGTAFVGDHLLAGHLVERRDRPGGRAHRIATAGADRVPGQPQADRVDAARPAADRSRGSGHRSQETGAPPLQRAPAALPAHPRRARGGARATRTGSPGTCGRRARSPSSRCSSSGRYSATSTCFSTRAGSPSRSSTTAAATGRRGFRCPSRPVVGTTRAPRPRSARETSTLYPGVDRSAESE